MEKDRRPDLAGRVNGLDISVFEQGTGVEISVATLTGQEVVLFRYSPPTAEGAMLQASPPALASSPPPPVPVPTPEAATQPRTETPTGPSKITGTIETVDGMGETPNAHDPVFRFSIRWRNPRTQSEEVRQVATFRQIAQGMQGFHTLADPDKRLEPGREIMMLAWDHPESASLYPQQINYLDFPPLTNPKTQKKRI